MRTVCVLCVMAAACSGKRATSEEAPPVEALVKATRPPAPLSTTPPDIATGCRDSLAYLARMLLTAPGDWKAFSDGELIAALRDALWRKRDAGVLTERERHLVALAELHVAIGAESLAMYMDWGEGDDFADALAGAKALGHAKLAKLLGRVKALYGEDGPSPDSDERFTQSQKIGGLGSKQLDRLDREYRALDVEPWLAAKAREHAASGAFGAPAGPPAVMIAGGFGGVREIAGAKDAIWLIDDDRCGETTRVIRVGLDGAVLVIDERPASPDIRSLTIAGARAAWLDGELVLTAPASGGTVTVLGRLPGPGIIAGCPGGDLLADIDPQTRITPDGTLRPSPPEDFLSCAPDAVTGTTATFPREPRALVDVGGRTCALVATDGPAEVGAIFCAPP